MFECFDVGGVEVVGGFGDEEVGGDVFYVGFESDVVVGVGCNEVGCIVEVV